MQRLLIAALSGGLFGAGLLVSGMTDTNKVQGWLDVFGDWDPTLAFVLGGAIIPMLIAWQLTKKRSASISGAPFPSKPSTKLDHNLIIGSVLFGIGWALVGLCPGPAMASLSWGGLSGALFFIAMLAGMLLVKPVRAQLDRVFVK
ncbi:MAG: hypothetical protein EA373_12665 [Oceanospirillales bacterium]|nr:MAG: hypothetical protein EA373_12665 [Oceanospirillales bacterium]